MINSLKKQVNHFKVILKSKDEELTNLKTNSKVAKYQIIENEYKIKSEECFIMRENFGNLKEAYDE